MGGQFAVNDGYLYVYFKDNNNNNSNFWDMSELAVARASIASITTSVNNNTTPVFNKYYNGKWEENGLGGKSSPLEKGNPSTAWIDVSYNTHLDKFVMVVAQYEFNSDYSIKTADLYLITSGDGVNWSSRVSVSKEAGELFYPSIIGTGDDPKITGQEFYLYYTHSMTGAWNRWNDLEFVRRKITLSK
jgi:hypothetical protein